MLNLESDRKGGEGGLDATDVSVLQVLATFAAVSLQMTALRDCPTECLAEQELEALLLKATALGSATLRQRITGMLFTVDYRRGVLRLTHPTQKKPIEILELGSPALVTTVVHEKRG